MLILRFGVGGGLDEVDEVEGVALGELQLGSLTSGKVGMEMGNCILIVWSAFIHGDW